MKKIVLTVALIASALIATNSQTLDDTYSCVNGHYENLNICFLAGDVTGTFRGTGSTLYFQPDAGVTYTQFAPCVDNYNKDRVTCLTAPLLVIGSGTKTKKTVAQ